MKKFFYSMLLLAVAGMTTTAFISCEEEEDSVIEKKDEVKEEYLAIKYWLSDDVLDIADVTTTGAAALKFNNSLNLGGYSGKESNLVELTGQQAKDANITVTVTLKSNWKELLSKKDEFVCADKHIIVRDKKNDVTFGSGNVNFHHYVREDLDNEKFEEAVSTTIQYLGFEYSANK